MFLGDKEVTAVSPESIASSKIKIRELSFWTTQAPASKCSHKFEIELPESPYLYNYPGVDKVLMERRRKGYNAQVTSSVSQRNPTPYSEETVLENDNIGGI